MPDINLIGDPTNPGKPTKKSQTLADQLSLGLPTSRPMDYQTEHDTYLPNGNKGSKYDAVLSNSQQNQSDVRDQNQSTWDKAANGLAKAGGLAATTYAGTFTSLPMGIGGSIGNVLGKLATGREIDREDFQPMIDNEFIRKYNEFNDYLEQNLVDYQSQEEQDTPAMSFKNIFTPNFLFDKIVKNAGFTIGAIKGGQLVGKQLGAASKIISQGALGAERVAEVEALLAQGMKLPQALDKVATTMKVLDKTSQVIASGIAASGEAQFEANDSYKSGLLKLNQDFEATMGRKPLPFEQANMEKRANAMGISTLGANMVILGLSDFIQFGNALTKGFKTEARGLGKTIMKDGVEVAKEVTGLQRWAPRIGGLAKGVVTEGAEEGSQTLVQKANYDYFSRKVDLDAKADVDGMIHAATTGIAELMGTKEGIESMLLGGLTGIGSHVVMGAATGELKSEWNKADDEYTRTQQQLEGYNDALKSVQFMSDYAKQNGLFKKYEGAVRGQSIQDSMNEAVRRGDIFEFQNLRNDRLKNIVQTFVEADRMHVLQSQLDSIKDLDENEFAELFGVDNIEGKTASKYVSTLKNQVAQMSKTWDSVQTRFPLATDAQKEQIWSSLVDADNRLTREKQLDLRITGLQEGSQPTKIPTFEALLMKHKGDRSAARKEYRDEAEKYLKDNSSSQFDISEVDEMFKLQDSRMKLVEDYQKMKSGEFTEQATQPKTKEDESKPQAKSQTTPTSTNAQPSASNVPVGSPGKPNEPAPTGTPVGNSDTPASNGQTANKNGGQEDEESLIKNIALMLAKKHKSGYSSLSTEDKKYNAIYNKPKKSAKEEAISDKADELFLGHVNGGTLDQFIKDAQVTSPTGSTGTPAPSADKKAEFSKKESDVLSELNTLNSALKKADSSVKLKELAKNYPAVLVSINELQKLADELGLEIGRVKALHEEVITRLPNYKVNKGKKGSSVTSDGTADKPKKEGKVDTLRPLRIVAKEGDKADTAYIFEETKDLYDSIASTGNGVMPSGLDGTMEATLVYDKENETFNIWVGDEYTSIEPTIIGYLQNTDKNRELYPAEYLQMQDELRERAKRDGEVKFNIKWNFGLNNNKTDKPQPLSKSVFQREDIQAIYKVTKTGLPDETRAQNLLLPGSKSSGAMGRKLVEMGVTDGYVLQVKQPDGSTRYIGMSAMPLDDSGFSLLRDILDNGEGNDKRTATEQIEELEKNFWIAAARPLKEGQEPFSLVWQKAQNGYPYIQVSKNAIPQVESQDGTVTQEAKMGDAEGDSISIRVNTSNGPIYNQENFLDSLEVFESDIDKFRARFGTSAKPRDLFAKNPLRQEIDPKNGEPSLDLFDLSVNGQKPWNVTAQIANVPKDITTPKQTAETKPETKPVEETPEVAPNEGVEVDAEELYQGSKKKKKKGAAFRTLNEKDAQDNSPLLKRDLVEIEKRLRKILPASIKTKDLSQLLKGLYNDGRTWGAFAENIIYISENAPIGTEYHEAFHAVFRSLLNRDEQFYLRNLLEKERVLFITPELIRDFKASRSEYRLLTDMEASLLIQEEALADMFMTYMRNRDSKSFAHRIFDKLKTLFDKLLSMIGFVRGYKSELDEVFESIARGRYKSRTAQENGSDILFKSLPTLSSDETTKLVGMVRQNLLDRYKSGDNPVKIANELVKEIAQRDDFSQKYQPNIHSRQWLIDNESYVDKATNRVLPAIFGSAEGREEIVDEVVADLAKYGVTIKDEAEGLGYRTVDDEGKRQKDIEYDTNTFSMTGFDNLDNSIKMFLTTLGTRETDGLVVPISVIGTFGQLQRNLAGLESFEDMVEAVRKKSESNPEMQAIYEALQKQGEDVYFRSAFRNAFTLEFAEHLHGDINEKLGTTKLYAANRQDTGQLQLEKFKRGYEALLAKGVDIKAATKAVVTEFNKVEDSYESGKGKSALGLVEALKTIGIDINPATINAIFTEGETVDGEEYGAEELADDIKKIVQAFKSGNPYKVTDAEMKDDSSESADAISRIKRLGKLDANYRNDIYETSFKNSEGENIQSFTKPNFELVRGREIKKGVGLDEDFYKNNYFLKKYGKLFGADLLKISIFGGLREESKDTGITTKKIDPKSKLIASHMLYSQGYLEWVQHEAKSTTAVVKVTKGSDEVARFTEPNGNLNRVALDAWKDFVKSDVNRIKQTIEDLKNLPKSQWIEGYHWQGKEARGYDPVTKEPISPDLTNPATFGNGLKMIQFPQLQAKVNEILAAQEEKDYLAAVEEATKDLDAFLQDQHNQMVEDYKRKLGVEGIDYKKNFVLLAGELSKRYSGENKEEKYLRDYVAGSYTLANSYDQLQLGDQAYYAGQVDKTKRAAGAMAAGNSLGTGQVPAAMIGDSFSLFNPITGEQRVTGYFDKVPEGFEHVNKSDAQSYMSARRWQFAMRQLGKLTKETDAIITKLIENPQSVTVEELRKVMEFATANPIKNVYFDGKVYVKTSIIPLFPQLTSTWSESSQEWIPKAEFAGLHHLRVQMEKNGIEEVYRESAMKLQRWNKHFADENGNFNFNEGSKFLLDNKYWRLQVENPSGKMKITLGTQLLQLIDSEMNNDDEVDFQGRNISIGELRGIYQKLLSDATVDSNTRAQALFNKVGTSDKLQTLLFNILKKSAASSGTSETALEYYDQNKKGKLKAGVNLPHMSEVFEQGILSYFNKNVFNKKVPGMKLTLVSSDGVKVRDKVTGEMRDLAIHKVVNRDGKEEISYAECYLSEEILHSYDLTLEEFEAQDEATKDEILSMLGFRIPTQSHHSMIPFKVVGFVPAYYGSVVFAPSEVTWLAGSDFDVDSLFVNRKEFYKGKDGKLHVYGKAQDAETQYKEWKKFIEKKDAGYELAYKLLKEDNTDIAKHKADIAGIKKNLKEGKRVEDMKKALAISKAELKKAEKQLETEVYKQLGYPSSYEEWLGDSKIVEETSYSKGVIEANKRPNTTLIPQNLVSGVAQYGTLQVANDEAKKVLGDSPTSIDMIDAGFRTRTTRTDAELEKYDLKVGSYTYMFGKSANGSTKKLLVKITKISKGLNPDTFNKEGWTQEGIQHLSRFKTSNAVEFEVVRPGTEKKVVRTDSSKSPQSMYSINNGVLDTMLSFMRNAANKESIFTPASMDSMKAMAKEIGGLLGESEDSSLPYTYPGSLFNHWKNNAAGKSNIGPAANASKTSAFLTKLGVQLKAVLRIGDAISEGYASNYEVGTETRKADQLSTLVSAMTDNAKERLAAKLNLTVDNLPVFGNMLALGFGMQRTMRFANQPILRRLSQRVINAKSHLLSEGTNWEVSQRFLESMEKIIGDAKVIQDLKTTEFSDADLLNSIKRENNDLMADIFASENLNVSKAKYQALDEAGKALFKMQYQVLNKYVNLEADTNYFRAVNTLLNTNKGPKPSYDAYDTLQEKVALLGSEHAPFDVLSAMSEKGKSIETNLTIAKDDIVPTGNDLFIHRTQRFRKMLESLAKWGRVNLDRKKSLKRGYVAQLSMLLLENTPGWKMAYPGRKLESFMHLLNADSKVKGDKANIVTKFNDIRAKYAKELGNNLALNQFSTREPNSKNPFYRLEYNSTMRTDPEFKEQLTSALGDLATFGDSADHPVRKFYNELYIYLALKDSLQYKNGSFISLFPPSRFSKIAKSLNEVQKILRKMSVMNSKEQNDLFRTITSVNPREFENQFLSKWVKEFANRNGWQQVNLDTAQLKALVHPKDEKSGRYDYQTLTINKALGEEKLKQLFEFGKQRSIMNDKGMVDFPRVLQTKKAPKDYADDRSDFAFNADVDLWINTGVKDGVATYKKVDIDNFNPRISPYALSLGFKMPKQERRTSVWDDEDVSPDDLDDAFSNNEEGDEEDNELEGDDDAFSAFDDEDGDSAFDPDEEDDSDVDLSDVPAFDPDDLNSVAKSAVQDAKNKLDLC